MNVHEGLEYIRWIRGLGGESCPRRPTLFSQTWEKGLLVLLLLLLFVLYYFLPYDERDRVFLSSVF